MAWAAIQRGLGCGSGTPSSEEEKYSKLKGMGSEEVGFTMELTSRGSNQRMLRG